MKTTKYIFIVKSNSYGDAYFSNKKSALKLANYIEDNCSLILEKKNDPNSTQILFNNYLQGIYIEVIKMPLNIY